MPGPLVDSPGEGAVLRRETLKRKLFRQLDQDGDGVLNSHEMRELAELSGFEGSDEEWKEEYGKLCEEKEVDPLVGVPEAIILALLDDKSPSSGLFFEDGEMEEFVRSDPLPVPPPPQAPVVVPPPKRTAGAEPGPGLSREALKKQLFAKCDRDGDGILSQAEMRDLADFVGFEGSEEEWPTEYSKLCEDYGVADDEGWDEAKVMALLDDESDVGCYCTTKELAEMLGATAAATLVPPPPRPPGQTSWVVFAGASPTTDEHVLRQHFEVAGTVLQFQLSRSAEGSSRGMGQVEFESEGEAWKAVEAINHKLVDGRPLMVKVDGPSEDRAACGKGGKNFYSRKGGAFGKGRYDFSGKGCKAGGRGGKSSMAAAVLPGCHRREGKSIFFKGASPETPPTYLQQIFAEAGGLQQLCLFRDDNGASRGKGIVVYQTARDAQRAIELHAGVWVDGCELQVKEDFLKEGASFETPQGCAARSSDLPKAVMWYEGSSQQATGSRSGNARHSPSASRHRAARERSPTAAMEDRGAERRENGGSGHFAFLDDPDRLGRGIGGGSPRGAVLPGRPAALGSSDASGKDLADWASGAARSGGGFHSNASTGPRAAWDRGAVKTDAEGRRRDVRDVREGSGDPSGAHARSQDDGAWWEQASWSGSSSARHGPEDLNAEAASKRRRGPANSGVDACAWNDEWTASHPSRGPAGALAVGVPPVPEPVHPTSRNGAHEKSGGLPGRTAVSEPSRTVFFLDAPRTATDNHLRSVFLGAGHVRRMTLYTCSDGSFRGMGCVEYATPEGAQEAMRSLHGLRVEGRPIKVVPYAAE